MMGGRYDIEMSNNESLILSASVYASGTLRDLSAYSGSMQVRTSAGATGTVLVATGTEISIATGTVSVNVAAARMASVDPGRYDYDLLLDASGSVERLLYGTLNVVQGVTR